MGTCQFDAAPPTRTIVALQTARNTAAGSEKQHDDLNNDDLYHRIGIWRRHPNVNCHPRNRKLCQEAVHRAAYGTLVEGAAASYFYVIRLNA